MCVCVAESDTQRAKFTCAINDNLIDVIAKIFL